VQHPLLRAGRHRVANDLFAYAQGAVLLLLITRELGLSPTVYGAIIAGFGAGGVYGSLAVTRVASELGHRGAIFVGVVLMAAGDALVVLAGGSLPLAGMGHVAGQLVTGLGLPLCTISMVSLRQAITPPDLLGRVNATTRLLPWSAVPLGALLGGALGATIGLRPTLVLSAGGSALVVAWVVYSLGRTRRAFAAHDPRQEPPV
jgi:predicted MFS family arabinose efflux permease